MQFERWSSNLKSRSRTGAPGVSIWTVANATDSSAAFEEQVAQSLHMLERHLIEVGSARTHLLSLQVMLADIGCQGAFDSVWREWIGPAPVRLPQCSYFQAALTPGLLVELVAVAAPASAKQVGLPTVW